MLAQSEGNYAEAFQNYYEATRLEIDPYDRSYILYNIGLIHTSNGEHTKALEYYFRALERNPFLPQWLKSSLRVVGCCEFFRLWLVLMARLEFHEPHLTNLEWIIGETIGCSFVSALVRIIDTPVGCNIVV